jgi:hypothetical protein
MKKIKIFLSATFLIVAFCSGLKAQVSCLYFSQGAGTFTLLTATYTQHTSGTTDYAHLYKYTIRFHFLF